MCDTCINVDTLQNPYLEHRHEYDAINALMRCARDTPKGSVCDHRCRPRRCRRFSFVPSALAESNVKVRWCFSVPMYSLSLDIVRIWVYTEFVNSPFEPSKTEIGVHNGFKLPIDFCIQILTNSSVINTPPSPR